ncbi:MAG TPA: helix-turn-helix domain-containing protein [Candidatus Acidoferrales bacterium]|jgi:AraC-like DNA-binding protein|nr:helix-turn-helix domain-containing protein [Candidatus Acidoferrales bacterium]
MENIGMVSTATVGRADRFAFWREHSGALFGNSHLSASEIKEFQGSIEHGELGLVRLCRLRASQHSVERTRVHAMQDHSSYLKVVFQVKGKCHFEQYGRHLVLSPGEWSVYDTRSPYTMLVPEQAEQLILLVPHEELRGVPIRTNLMARSFSSKSGLGRLMYKLLTTTLSEFSKLGQQSEPSLIAVVNQLLNFSILEALQDNRSLSDAESLELRARAYVVQNVRDSDLSVEQIANALHCSKRYLHMVFAKKGETISELIWKLRLEGCRRDLRNPALANPSITDIAFSWGFNNSAHFSRRFRDEFGTSPKGSRWKLVANH